MKGFSLYKCLFLCGCASLSNASLKPRPSYKQKVIGQIWALLLGGLGLAGLLDLWAGHDTPVILGLSAFGSLISYIYSAPPLKVRA